MADPSRPYDFDRVVRLVLTAGTIGIVLWLLAYLSDVLAPFVVAILVAYLLNPIANAFESRLGSRPMAVGLTLAILGVLLFVTVPILAWVMVNETNGAIDVLTSPELKLRLREHFEGFGALLDDRWKQRLLELQAYATAQLDALDRTQIQEMAVKLGRELFPVFQQLKQDATRLLGNLLSAVFALSVGVVILLYVVFIMLDFHNFQAHWKDQLPPAYRATIVDLINEFTLAMGRYFRGQFFVALACGVLYAIGFWLLGLRMAILLGLMIGMLNMVPYLQAAGFIPALLLGALKGLEPGGQMGLAVGGVVVVFIGVQLIQDGLLVPRIMGQSTGLKPWVIMLSIFVWGKLLGFLGLVLAIPLSCLGLAYYRRMVLNRPASA